MKRLSTFTIIALLSSINTFGQAIPQDSLVGWYPFNGNAKDASGNCNNGVVVGAKLTLDRFNNNNSAYVFNGTTDMITFTNQLPLNKPNIDASISIWIKANTLQNNTQATFLKSNTSANDNNRFNLFLNPTSSPNQSLLKLNVDYRESNSNIHILNIKNDLLKGAWQHIALTRANNTYNLYVNGILINSIADNVPNLPNAIGWVLGNDPSSNSDFNGVIDDIRIYNKALTVNEITSLYNENTCFKSISVSDTLRISSLTGFNDIPFEFGTIKVYPNPSNDVINIAVSNPTVNYIIKVINQQSQTVYTATLNTKNIQFNTNLLGTKGLYFMQILDNTNKILDVKKLVIE